MKKNKSKLLLILAVLLVIGTGFAMSYLLIITKIDGILEPINFDLYISDTFIPPTNNAISNPQVDGLDMIVDLNLSNENNYGIIYFTIENPSHADASIKKINFDDTPLMDYLEYSIAPATQPELNRMSNAEYGNEMDFNLGIDKKSDVRLALIVKLKEGITNLPDVDEDFSFSLSFIVEPDDGSAQYLNGYETCKASGTQPGETMGCKFYLDSTETESGLADSWEETFYIIDETDDKYILLPAHNLTTDFPVRQSSNYFTGVIRWDGQSVYNYYDGAVPRYKAALRYKSYFTGIEVYAPTREEMRKTLEVFGHIPNSDEEFWLEDTDDEENFYYVSADSYTNQSHYSSSYGFRPIVELNKTNVEVYYT